jgi:hypothetical protein
MSADRQAARAAHAEAMELLLRYRKSKYGAANYSELDRRVDRYLAKHQNKDASK